MFIILGGMIECDLANMVYARAGGCRQQETVSRWVKIAGLGHAHRNEEDVSCFDTGCTIRHDRRDMGHRNGPLVAPGGKPFCGACPGESAGIRRIFHVGGGIPISMRTMQTGIFRKSRSLVSDQEFHPAPWRMYGAGKRPQAAT